MKAFVQKYFLIQEEKYLPQDIFLRRIWMIGIVVFIFSNLSLALLGMLFVDRKILGLRPDGAIYLLSIITVTYVYTINFIKRLRSSGFTLGTSTMIGTIICVGMQWANIWLIRFIPMLTNFTFPILASIIWWSFPISNTSFREKSSGISEVQPMEKWSTRIAKVIIALLFLWIALPSLWIWMALLLMICDAPENCRNGMPLIFWILISVPLLVIILIVLLILSSSKPTHTRLPEFRDSVLPDSQDERNIRTISFIQNLNTDKIDGIHFIENSGKSYTITLDSIKKIAKYLEVTYRKMDFKPNELLLEKDFLIKYYESKLSEEHYTLLTNILGTWVESGGRFEIIVKK